MDDALAGLVEDPGLLKGKVLVNMGTNPPAFSRQLDARLEKAGAVFVDAPVSGTQVQAMEGDFAPQASIGTVREMLKHITDTAYEMNAFIPNTLSNVNLIAAAMDLGLAEEDVCAIIKVFSRPPAVH